MDLTDEAKSIKKRKGYGTAFTLSDSTSPVHGTYLFYDTDGSDVVLAFNGSHINRSISGGDMSVIWSSATNGATYQCTDSAGFAYCANTSRDAIFKIDASAISELSGFTSTGTMVAVTPERLIQSGFSTDPNVILFSASNDFSNWTLAGNPTSPIQFTITAPGSGVKCIAYAHGRVYWWKDNSFGFILEGATQADWRVVTIDPGLGSINNTYIYREEILYFQGNDGHFYAYDGSQLAKLSKDIEETISQTQGRTTNSWSQSSQSDFSAGLTSPQGFISSSIVSGQLMPSSFTVTETTLADFSQGTFSNSFSTAGWVVISTANQPPFNNFNWNSSEWSFGTGVEGQTWSRQTGNATSLCSSIVPKYGTHLLLGTIDKSAFPAPTWVRFGIHDAVTGAVLNQLLVPYVTTTDCQYVQKTLTVTLPEANPRRSIYIRIYLDSYVSAGATSNNFMASGNDFVFYLIMGDAASNVADIVVDGIESGFSYSTGTYTSKSYDTGISTNLVSVSSIGVTINEYNPTLTLQTSHDSSTWRELASGITNSTVPATYTGNRYLRYISSFTVTGSSDAYSTLDNVTLIAKATGTYYSEVHNASSLSSWDTFATDQQENGGSLSWFIRSSTGVFYASATAVPAWGAISPGAIPSISTNPYFQVASSFSITAATQNPTVNSFTVNWFEGGASDKTYAIYHKNENWWAVTSGEGATANNKILKFNLLNPGWYIYDIGMGGMYVRSQSLYFGAVDSGKVFKFGDVSNDNGSAINSYWKSKDFFGPSPFLEKNYSRFSSVHPQVSNSTMTVTYTIDGSSSTSYNIPLTWGNSSFISRNVNLPQGKNGKTFNVQFGNNAADQDWEVFGAQLDYTLKSWVPTQ